MIHPRELEILNILWNSEEPLTSSDIVECGNRLSQSTVQAVLRKLLKAGLIEVMGKTHSGNVLSRTYKPTEASREVIKNQFASSYFDIQHIVSMDSVVAAMLHMEKNSVKRKNELANLKQILNDYEEKLNENT